MYSSERLSFVESVVYEWDFNECLDSNLYSKQQLKVNEHILKALALVSSFLYSLSL